MTGIDRGGQRAEKLNGFTRNIPRGPLEPHEVQDGQETLVAVLRTIGYSGVQIAQLLNTTDRTIDRRFASGRSREQAPPACN